MKQAYLPIFKEARINAAEESFDIEKMGLNRWPMDKHKAKLLEIEKSRLQSLQALADAIAKQSITIEANANDEGHLYGSVGPGDIAAALKRNEISINEDQVRLEGPLKELGLYTVKVHLGQDIDTELKVWVVPTVASEAEGQEAQSPSG